jgi:hypothetical protein
MTKVEVLRTAYYEGYIVTGNQYLAIAINVDNPQDVQIFAIDPEVNNDAFIRACGWAYEPEMEVKDE